MMEWSVNNTLDRMWKKAALAEFNLLPSHVPGGNEEKHEHFCQDSQSPGRDMNPGPP